MAEYDGSIRINTEIDSKKASASLMNLENRIIKTADKVSLLRTKMDSLKNAQIPTQAYTEIQNQIAETEKKLNALYDRQEKFLATGGKTYSTAYQKMQYDIAQFENTLTYARSELQDLVDTGKAFTLGAGTQEYTNLSQQLGYAENELSALNQRHDELIAKQNGSAKGYSDLGNVARNTFKNIEGFVRNAASGISLFGKSVKNLAQKIFPSLNSSVKKSNNVFGSGFKAILKYGLGIRSLYLLVNKVRTAIKEGFKNLAQFSDETNASISSVMSALSQLKNSLATAFAPILNYVAPAITKLIDLLSSATAKIAEFMSALTGKSTYVKAIKVNENYAESLNNTASAAKSAANALFAFDELNVVQKKDTATSGTATDASQMFEEVPISGQAKNIADWIKSMWENADFYELGNLVGTKIRDALNSINWENIKSTAQKIGKSLGTLINGFIEVDGLGESIGRTIGEAINTGVAGAKEFFVTTNFMALGQEVATTLNTAMDTVEWDELAQTISLGIEGALDTAIGFLDEFDWELFADSIYEFLSNIDYGGIFGRLGLLILETFRGVFATGNKLGVKLTSSLSEFFRSIGWDSVAGFFQGLSERISEYGELVKESFQKVIDWTKEKLGIHSPSTVFAEIGEYCIEGLVNGMMNMVNYLMEYWDYLKQITTEKIESIKESLSTSMQNIKDSISKSLTSIKSTWSTTWTNLKTTVLNIFDEMWNSLKKTINVIIGGVETMANGVVDGINTMINALNNLHFDIPDWVPGLGGKSFSLNIPTLEHIEIPKLATGAVLPANKPFMAVVGDQKHGTNVEAPLDTIKQAVREVLQDYDMGTQSGDVYISAEGDLDALIRLLKFHIDKENKRVGKNFEKVVTV